MSLDSLLPINYTLIFYTNLVVGDFLNFDTLYNQDLDTAQILITSNANLNYHSSINIFPNPTDDYLNIIAKDIQIEEMALYSIQGELIEFIPKYQKELNLSHLNNGIYVLRIKTDVGWINRKIIKQ